MNPLMKLHPILLSSALMTLVAQPGLASVTSITNVRVNTTATGIDLVFETQGGDNSNIFTVNQGNTLQADITRAQLNLPDGNGFSQANPAPGISQITVAPLDANSVRVIVSGTDQSPIGEVASNGRQMVLSIRNDGEVAQAPTPVPAELVTVPAPATPSTVAQAVPEVPTPANPNVLVPNPEVTIDGTPVPRPQVQQAPPFLPRAVAPPVGDIAVAETQVVSGFINLGSNERIPRLLLRDASSREVLSLLARTAGLNVVFATGSTDSQQDGAASSGGPTVSLDIENESVQDVFNHVLRVTGLQANRIGRSIYVGLELPDDARNIVSRTLRLNQTGSIEAAGFLASLGAEATQTIVRPQVEVIEVESAEEGVPPIRRVIEFETTTIEQLTFNPTGESFIAQPLRGLQVISDNRLNSLTLVGEADLVTLASEYIANLDLRLRQVAINVKVIDLNLNATENFGTSFTYLNNGLSIGFGGAFPGGLAIGANTSAPSLSSRLILQIEAAIRNQNAKIITDPTLVIQEGQTSSIALVESVLTSLTTQVSPETGAVTSVTPVFADAGLILQVQVQRIDDNGFVTFNIAPQISSPQPPVVFASAAGPQQLTPISRREVSSGSIRVRDGQTLVLAGIIAESETASTTKIPILGDLPILGALFRRIETTGRRNEVVILLTPQILDDSDQSVWGYRYDPSEQVQEVLENRGR
ncbi:MAG: type II secretory pathway, component HofQ [Leptolyngbya sp.]|nr:MAG: type II secretory pathway, component HofQ [Leptolyngbya sp.]